MATIPDAAVRATAYRLTWWVVWSVPEAGVWALPRWSGPPWQPIWASSPAGLIEQAWQMEQRHPPPTRSTPGDSPGGLPLDDP